MDASESRQLTEEQFTFCLATLIYYYHREFLKVKGDYLSQFNSCDSNSYDGFVKIMTKSFPPLNTVWKKLEKLAAGKSEFNLRDIFSTYKLFELPPESKVSKFDEVLRDNSKKNELKTLVMRCDSIDEILKELKFGEYKPLKPIEEMMNSLVKEKLKTWVKHLEVNEDFFNIFYDLLSNKSKRERLEEKLCQLSKVFVDPTNTSRNDIEELFYKLGLLPFGLIMFKKDWEKLEAETGREDYEVENAEVKDCAMVPISDSSNRYFRDFKDVKYIGSGSFGTLMKVRYRLNSSKRNKNTRDYAIKMILLDESDYEKDPELILEVKNMRKFQGKVFIIQLEDTWIEDFNLVKIEQFPKFFSSVIQNEFSSNEKLGRMRENNGSTVETSLEEKEKTVKVHFILMKYCQENLKSFCSRRKMADFDKNLTFALQLSEGLAELHENKYYHGDLRDENILFRFEKGEYNLKICDFDMAQSTKTSVKAHYSKTRRTDEEKYDSDMQDLPVLLLELFYCTKNTNDFDEHVKNLLEKSMLPQDFHETTNGLERLTKVGELIVNLIRKKGEMTAENVHSELHIIKDATRQRIL
jgi:hypothetical protein